MSFLKKYLGIIWHWLKLHRLKLFVFFILIGVFFLIRFPYGEGISFLLDRAFRRSQIQLRYDNFYISPFGPALVFENPNIQIGKSHRYVKLDQLRVLPSYKALFSLRPGGVFIFKWRRSDLILSVRKTNWGNSGQRLVIMLKAINFDPSVLHSMWPLLSKLSGAFYLNMEIEWDDTQEIQLDGFWNVTGGEIQIKALSYTFPGTIGTISLPHFHWSHFYSNGRINKNSIVISDVSIGKTKDPFQLKTRGILSLDIRKKSFSSRPAVYLKNYDIGMEILANEDLKSKLYFLDLLFSSVEKKTPVGSRYLARIKGNSASFFNLFAVPKLPTLKEIQSPKQK